MGEDITLKVDNYTVIQNKQWPDFKVDFSIDCSFKCQSFVFYDHNTGFLHILGSKLSENDYGFYSIRVIAVFKSISLQEEQIQTKKSKLRL